ncbi:hypothetical protein B1757_13165 [Acidithiobacillus marinus]|uniref:Ig-like domain-containing protein n=1 Tax=Acidithiobacillus marinus TaxID=187490 RepID=A0A2I1DIT5_9PROT|nr:hypothetical protein B1757_13165 [Acidithiobacillus marinus]
MRTYIKTGVTTGLLLIGCVSITAFAADSPMEPGLWSMQISGTTRVSSPAISTPMQRTTLICVKAHQTPQKVFIPAGSSHCTSSHQVLPDGKTQWTFHCQAPGATVIQKGWFHTGAHHLDSQWTVTDHIHAAAHYTAITNMQIRGTRLSGHCGDVK